MSPLVQKILILIGFVLFLHFQESTAIICYDCNSEFDPRCADPFDPYSIGEVNCSKKAPLEHLKDKYKPTLCRKTTQKVYGKIRVVRGCGYIPDEKDDKECLKRSGTHDVQAIYCACTTDKCNSAPKLLTTTTITSLLPIAITVILIAFTKSNCNLNIV